ncbi:hypothetical protein FR742_10095 [Nonomuraea sp. C10]|nr:hypothetical protein FR742_10095 [Nonomuraea sp. C10]
MRICSATAALLASAVLGGVAWAPAAHARPAQVGLAWIPTCTERSGITVPCPTWRLLAPGGGVTTSSAVAGVSVDRRGRSTGEAAPLAVSADGRSVAHQRSGDHRLVVWHLPSGRRTLLPRSLLPKGAGTDLVSLTLSPAGDRVLVDYLDQAERVPTKLYTLATRRTSDLRGGDTPIGFSPGGDRVLTERVTADNTTALVVHEPDGTSVRRTPPQVVANAPVKALARDGRTVAVVVSGHPERGKPPRLRLYDLATGKLTEGVDLALAPGDTPFTARWGEGGKLTVAVPGRGKGGTAVVRVLTADPATGAVKQTERYTTGKDPYFYTVAGE